MGSLTQIEFILLNRFHRQTFYNFLKREFCAESLECWLQIQVYKRKPSKKKFLEIYDQYIKKDEEFNNFSFNARVEVNIDSRLRQKMDMKAANYRREREKAKSTNWLWRKMTTSSRLQAQRDDYDEVEKAREQLMTDPMRRFTDTTDGQVAARDYRSFRGPHGRDLLQVFNNLESCGLLEQMQPR